ncbi:hypothetical protein B5S33_g1903 [[Candida] boidinii]|nr:hypothetical protein B5S33_g1903 [[Candida] boidinii]
MAEIEERSQKRIKLDIASSNANKELIAIQQNVAQIINNDGKKPSFLLDLPLELIDTLITLGDLENKDIKNLSIVNSSFYKKYNYRIFKKINLNWNQIKLFNANFTNKVLVNSILIKSNLINTNETKYGEWNIPLDLLLKDYPNLNKLTIETLTSSRFLKYQDKIDLLESEKIEELGLISHSNEPGSDSMFELTQLIKFNHIKKLSLNGYLLTKDNYFIPKLIESPSSTDAIVEGTLPFLQELSLINCKWEFPFNLCDIFSPIYQSFNNPNLDASPETVSLYYSNDNISFIYSERFKSFLNTFNDDSFAFQTRFYKNLKNLSIVINYDDETTTNNTNYNNGNSYHNKYYPPLNLLDLKRQFKIQSKESDRYDSTTVLSNLNSLTLIGWRLNNVSELDKIFKFEKLTDLDDESSPYKMNFIKLILIKPIDEVEKEFLTKIYVKLDEIFNFKNQNNCKFDVQFLNKNIENKLKHHFKK